VDIPVSLMTQRLSSTDFFFDMQEIGILINPEDGTDDALGLIKHLSEHAASAYLEAEEILAMEPAKEPLSITVPTSPTFKERAREDESSCKENMFSLDNNFGGDTLSPFSSYLSVCCRVLIGCFVIWLKCIYIW